MVFIVKGTLPEYDAALFSDNLRENQIYMSYQEIKNTCDRQKASGEWGLNVNGTDEIAYEKALKESMKTYDNENKDSGDFANKFGNKDSEDAAPKEPISNFTGQGATMGGGKLGIYNPLADMGMGNDPELAMAIRMSYGEIFDKMPEKTPDTVDLKIRMLDGKNETFRFGKMDQVRKIYDFCFWKMEENCGFSVSSNYPRKTFDNLDLTLQEAGLNKPSALNVAKD
jgi:hypothetical protein